MDASTRLYKRLGEIPEDPDDPESLDDLVICAFGAFERYYLCWKTKGGEYKQDDYGLPPALKKWLYPSDGTTRDFASLQVVFGRGEEYFASDKDGKLEYKEPDIKKTAPADDEEKSDKQALRRSRTVSFLRPLSDTTARSDSAISYASRSQSTFEPTFGKGRESMTSQTPVQAIKMPSPTQSLPMADTGPKADSLQPRPNVMMSPSKGTCGCHTSPILSRPTPPQSTYTNASTQTSPPLSPPRTALRIDTESASFPSLSQNNYTAVPYDSRYDESDYDTPPVFMGRMSAYFSKPGYQLGDSLFSGYQPINWGVATYEYQDTFGEEALR
ncbi:hypothetical protein DDE83_000056 [Stemphylium lycopersici]|uniref:Uncharacterized protein n=1 Tax=Stemphylium lycopersici TaxID=183478 RepID=A0A364NHB4_STELY|nr:hypothetical protein DDE83_000056 [Stemphylium lycopersici]